MEIIIENIFIVFVNDFKFTRIYTAMKSSLHGYIYSDLGTKDSTLKQKNIEIDTKCVKFIQK